jgi:hypothetical protein
MAMVDTSDFRREIESTITIGKANVIRSKDKKGVRKQMTLFPTSTPASEELTWRVNSLEETLKYIGKSGEGGGIRLERKSVLIQRFFTVY